MLSAPPGIHDFNYEEYFKMADQIREFGQPLNGGVDKKIHLSTRICKHSLPAVFLHRHDPLPNGLVVILFQYEVIKH